ncbi:hypothetical protein F5883DRAFT_647470 [Diaporthe sp. PMI_573]|nr:hypothetical protein F5883DRAFT_647470 [Diaporthaceae sp. PMI_573]
MGTKGTIGGAQPDLGRLATSSSSSLDIIFSLDGVFFFFLAAALFADARGGYHLAKS